MGFGLSPGRGGPTSPWGEVESAVALSGEGATTPTQRTSFPMSLILLTPPAGDVVTLAEMRDHLRISATADDALITAITSAASRAIETRCGLALLTQGWRLTLDHVRDQTIRLPITPLQHIDEIAVSGTVIDSADYDVVTGSVGRVVATHAWPVPGEKIGGLVIEFTAGFGLAADIPSPLVQAVKMLTAHFYENREAAAEARIYNVPASIDALIAPYKEVRI